MIEYLEMSFRIYQPLAFKSNFNLFLKIQWIKLLDQIESDLEKDKSVNHKNFLGIFLQKKIFILREVQFFSAKCMTVWTY